MASFDSKSLESHVQSDLFAFDSLTPASHPVETPSPSRSPTSRATEDTTLSIADARRAEYVGFLHRAPFATEAYNLGFVTGLREDCRLQVDHLRNVDIPILMLDNDFNNPDLERYLERFHEVDPEIGVVGDARTADEAHTFVDAARKLKEEFPDVTIIIAPKCREAIDIVATADVPGNPLVLGYAMGRSKVKAWHFSDIADWRGLPVHLLGASPTEQWRVIQQLTQPNLAGDPPANIVGLDWNGPQGIAYKGESWSRDGWQRADHLTIRHTVRRSLREMRAFWEERGVWPCRGSTPIERRGPAVREPDDPVFAANGADLNDPGPLPSPDEWEKRVDYNDDEIYPVEQAIVATYEDGRTLAYRSQTERDYVEYNEGLCDCVVDESDG
jgi:hypothetical protein